MTKQKKIIVIAVAALFAVALLVGALCGIRAYMKNHKTFVIKDTLADGQGKTARVILLGGQSNAAGCSLDAYLQKNVSATQYAEYQNGYDNVYINYYVSDHHASEEFVKCKTGQGEPDGYFGPELGLAEKLNELYPDETFFIIKCTWSGTDLFEQWLSPSSEGKTGKLYRQFVAYVKTSLKYLKDKNYDIKVEGMCWMQGESDSFSVEHGTGYATHLANFIADIRKEFKRYAADDGIAFVDAYIADNPVYWVFCDLVNASKDTVAAMSPLNVLVDTVAAGLTCAAEPAEQPDMAHYDSMSEIKLGHMFAEALVPFLN